MVAIFTGAHSGLQRSSGTALGSTGLLGDASLGRGGENVGVNAATGNLVISHQDEFLVGAGPDIALGRVYNCIKETGDGDNGDQWRLNTSKKIYRLAGTVNTTGSLIRRITGDGAEVTYTWDANRATYTAYFATDGAESHDTLEYSGGNWIWTDGKTRATETYVEYPAGTGSWRIVSQTDADGRGLTYSYTSNKLDKVTSQDGSWTQYIWSGNDVVEIKTRYTDYATSTNKTFTRTRFAYDASHRLITVTVDLSPEDSSTADGNAYVTNYTYDGTSKRVASITQTDGSSLAIVYDDQERVASLTQLVAGGTSRVTKFFYAQKDEFGLFTEIREPDGSVTRLGYDGLGQMTRISQLDGKNLIYNADFAQGTAGWESWNPSNIIVSGYPQAGIQQGKGYIELQVQATAANQEAGLSTKWENSWSVIAGHEYDVRVGLQSTGVIAWAPLFVQWRDSNQNVIASVLVGSDTTTNAPFNHQLSGVVKAPPGAVSAHLDQLIATTGAGSGSVKLIEPRFLDLGPSSNLVVNGDLLQGTYGWDIWNGSGLILPGYPVTGNYYGQNCLEVQTNASASGQVSSFITDSGNWWPVSPGHQYAATAQVEATGAINKMKLQLWWRDAQGQIFAAEILQDNIAAPATFGTAIGGIATAPPEAVSARFELYFYSSGPGAGKVRLIQPRVTDMVMSGPWQTQTFAYDADGNMTRFIDASGAISNYSYDTLGNLLVATDPLGNQTVRTYGTRNELLTETSTGTDETGAAVTQTKRYAYDSVNRLRYTLSADGRVSYYGYDTAGNNTQVLDFPQERFNLAGYASNAAPSNTQLDNWRNGLANPNLRTQIERYYDARGNLTREVRYADPGALGEGYSETFFTYDQAGQLLSRTTNGLTTETFLYDGMGRLKASTDLNGGTTSIAYQDSATTTVVTSATGSRRPRCTTRLVILSASAMRPTTSPVRRWKHAFTIRTAMSASPPMASINRSILYTTISIV